jgi:hypothetical protein
MKTYGELMYRSMFSWSRYWLEALASRHDHFTPRERAHGIPWIGGWVGSGARLDDVEKWKFLTLPGLELRLLGRPARSQSIYRLIHSPGLSEGKYENVNQDGRFQVGVQVRFPWNESLKRYCWANPLHRYLELALGCVTAIVRLERYQIELFERTQDFGAPPVKLHRVTFSKQQKHKNILDA